MTSYVHGALAQFQHVAIIYLLIALGFHLANFLLRSLAWRGVLRAAFPDQSIRLPRIAGAYTAGVAVNAFMPARAGDLVKIAMVRAGISGSNTPAVASSMAVLGVLDAVIGLMVMLVLWWRGVLPTVPGVHGAVQHVNSLLHMHGGVLIGGAIVGVVCGAIVAAVRTTGMRRRFAGFAWKVVEGASILRSPRAYARDVVPFQLGAWASRVGAMYCLLAAFHMHPSAPIAAAAVTASGMATLVPTPGGVGTQQALLVYLMQATASVGSIVTFSLATQGAMTLVNVTLGTIAMMVMFRTARPLAALRQGVRLGRNG